MPTLKILRLSPHVRLPAKATDGSACLDFFLPHDLACVPGIKVSAGLGIAAEVPEGHVLFLFSRSGHGFTQGIRLSNCVGVIDSDYRGEIRVSLHKDHHSPYIIGANEAVVQGLLIPIPEVEVEEVNELSPTKRGANGLGSTTKNPPAHEECMKRNEQ